jgi:hypothetical protein
MKASLVYKYCDERGVAILESRTLRITPPIRFNDPFEFSPSFEGFVPRSELRQLVISKENIRELYNEEKQAGRFGGNFREFRKRFKPAAKPIMDVLRAHAPNVLEYARKKILPEVSELIGVLCLSECHDNILMWGHYGRGHTGFVIAFDPNHPFFKIERGLRKVMYVENRPVYSLNERLSPGRKVELGIELALCKSLCWQYEEELRQVFRLHLLEKRALSDGRDEYFMPINPEMVKAIILGLRTKEKTKAEIRKILRAPEWKHVETKSMRLHEKEYALITESEIDKPVNG